MCRRDSWQAFGYVTRPEVGWALLYGVVVTNARAVGEFGAVSVVSGLIRGETLAVPLLVQRWNQDCNAVGAFNAAGLLAAMALVTLLLKTVLEWATQHNTDNVTEQTTV